EHIEGLTTPYNTSLELDLTSISQEPLTVRSKASGISPNEGSPLRLSGWIFEKPDSGDDEPTTRWVVGIRRDANIQTKICLGSLELRLLDEDREGAVIASGRVPLRSLLHQTTTIEGLYPLTLAAEYAAVTEGSGEPQEEGTDQDLSGGPTELGAEQAPTVDALVKISSDSLIGNVEDFPSDWCVLTLQVHGMSVSSPLRRPLALSMNPCPSRQLKLLVRYNLPQPLLDAAGHDKDEVVGEEAAAAACFLDDSHPLQYTITLGEMELSEGRLHRWASPPVATAADDDHEAVDGGEGGEGDGSDKDTPTEIRVEAEEFRRKIEALGYPVGPSAVRALYEALADGRQGCVTKASFDETLSVADRAEGINEAARVAGLLQEVHDSIDAAHDSSAGRPVTGAPNMITQEELAEWLQRVTAGAGAREIPQPVEGSDAVDEDESHATAKVIFGLLGVSEGGLHAHHLTALYLYRRVEMIKKLGMLRKACVAGSGSIADAYEAMGSEKGVDVHGFADYMKAALSEEDDLSGEDIDLSFHWLDSDGDGYVSAADIMVLGNSEVFETLFQLKTAAEMLSSSNTADRGAMTRREVERLLMAEDTFKRVNSGIKAGHVFNFLALNRSGTVDDELVRFMAQLDVARVCGLVEHFRTWALKRFGTVDNILSYLGKEVGMEDSETPQLGPLVKWGLHTVEAYKGRHFLRTVRALHCGSSSHELEAQWLYIDISVPEATPESTNKKGGKKDGGAGGGSDALKNVAKRYRGKARVPLGRLASTRSIEGVAAVVTAEPVE
ncbi:hypothetical protein FOZ63_028151, partial [Perkinsus olseni]